MIECIIRYYFKSAQGRIVRFERAARFPAVPYVGSQLTLKDDSLQVEHIQFCEDASPFLIVQEEKMETDSELDDQIDEMKERGWKIASDVTKTARSTSKT